MPPSMTSAVIRWPSCQARVLAAGTGLGRMPRAGTGAGYMLVLSRVDFSARLTTSVAFIGRLLGQWDEKRTAALSYGAPQRGHRCHGPGDTIAPRCARRPSGYW